VVNAPGWVAVHAAGAAVLQVASSPQARRTVRGFPPLCGLSNFLPAPCGAGGGAERFYSCAAHACTSCASVPDRMPGRTVHRWHGGHAPWRWSGAKLRKFLRCIKHLARQMLAAPNE